MTKWHIYVEGREPERFNVDDAPAHYYLVSLLCSIFDLPGEDISKAILRAKTNQRFSLGTVSSRQRADRIDWLLKRVGLRIQVSSELLEVQEDEHQINYKDALRS